MRLSDLVAGAPDLDVTAAAIDSRRVVPGSLFGAFPGARHNGEDFIAEAIANGAVAVVARPEARVEGALHIADANPRACFARLAARLLAPYPRTIVAVTGTNGKTSTVELTRQLWRQSGCRAASMGTLGIIAGDDRVAAAGATGGLTTPDIVTFLTATAGLAREGITHLAHEASSHGLDQHRCEGPRLAAAAFTNLSRDHLDYHGTMEAYFAAKLRLFTELLPADGVAVVWADGHPWSDRVSEAVRGRGQRLFTVGAAGADLRLIERAPTPLGQRLLVAAAGQRHGVHLPLIGAYQAANALLAAGLVIATGGDTAGTLAALAHVQPVPGRLERAALLANGAAVYVDYAHTPDALEAAMEALRPHARGHLILVFGAGGERDPGKRSLMGAVAARAADHVIVTDDNPRSEDPAAIRNAILAAAPGAQDIADRRDAIAAGLRMAGGDDVVLIAGKGHEQGQQIGDRILPFDDVQVVREMAALLADGTMP